MTDDVLREKWRDDTPGCENQIHLNNAGASLMPVQVSDAIHQHIELEMEIGGYEARHHVADAINEFYAVIGDLIGASPQNIAYAENGTIAYNRALTAIPFQPGDVILTTVHDYVSNQIAFISLAKRFGVRIIRAMNKDGVVDVGHMEELINKHQPRLVSVTHIPTNSGVIQPVETIGQLCSTAGILYIVDAVQSVGQLPVDVKQIQCDFLSVTARKFLRGPRGAGFLYVSDRVLDEGLEPLFVDLRGSDWTMDDDYRLKPDARRFEMWEVPYALLLGLKAAAKYASAIGLNEIEKRAFGLASQLRKRAQEIEGIRVMDQGSSLSAIVSLAFDHMEEKQLGEFLKNHRINYSISSADNALLDFSDKNLEWALRLSPHYFNTSEEIETVIQTLKKLAESSREQKKSGIK